MSRVTPGKEIFPLDQRRAWISPGISILTRFSVFARAPRVVICPMHSPQKRVTYHHIPIAPRATRGLRCSRRWEVEQRRFLRLVWCGVYGMWKKGRACSFHVDTVSGSCRGIPPFFNRSFYRCGWGLFAGWPRPWLLSLECGNPENIYVCNFVKWGGYHCDSKWHSVWFDGYNLSFSWIEALNLTSILNIRLKWIKLRIRDLMDYSKESSFRIEIQCLVNINQDSKSWFEPLNRSSISHFN